MAVHDDKRAPDKGQALERLRSGALVEARAMYEQICRTDPKDADAWHMLSAVNGMLGLFPAAETCARRVIELVPTADSAFSNLGNALLAQNRTDEARRCFEKALALNPTNPETHNSLGILCQRAGDNEAAARHFQQALALNGNYAEACNNLGTALQALERRDEALACFDRALQLQPGYADAHFNAGKVLQELGRLQDALGRFQQTLALRADHLPARLGIAHVLADTGHREDALVHYQHVLTTAPDPKAYLGIVKIHNDRQEFEQAIETCERALAHYPDEIALRQALARALHAVGRAEQAIETLRAALAMDPDNVQAVHALAAFGGSPTPQRAAPEYVAQLFDGYADNFDHHLVEVLEYRTPQLLHELVIKAADTDLREQDILDLGCGTGLCAPLFRDHAKRLVGVDLSARMIDRARERGLYDDLHVDDLVNIMAAAPNAYDLVLAADVFVYVGELSDIFDACRDCLRPGGLFAFSTEALAGDDRGYALHPTGRYAHAPAYLYEQAARAGFAVLSNERAMIRKNEGTPVSGHISLLRKAAPHPG